MPRFTVLITRDVTKSTVVTVEADDAEAAEVAAFNNLQTTEDAVWNLDDGSWNQRDVYFTGVDHTED